MTKVTILILTSALCMINAYGMYQQPPMPYDAVTQPSDVVITFGPFQGSQPTTAASVVASAPPVEYAPLPIQGSMLLAPNRCMQNRKLIESIGSTECSTKMCANVSALIACNFFKNLYFTFGTTPAATLSDVPLPSLIGVGIDWTLCLGIICAGFIQERRKIAQETELLTVLDQLDQIMLLDTSSVPADKRANHPSFKRSSSIMITTEYETVPSPESPLAVHQQQAQQIILHKENGTLKTKAQLYALFSTLFGALCLKDLIIYRDQRGISAINSAVEGSLAIGSLLLSFNATEKQHEQEEIISAYASHQPLH